MAHEPQRDVSVPPGEWIPEMVALVDEYHASSRRQVAPAGLFV